MSFAINYLLVLIWLAYLISGGVYLFSRGFLLSRVSQQDISSCRKLSEDFNEEYYLNREIVQEIFKDVNASSNLCLPKKTKVVILVVDALRYDFGLYKPDLDNPLPYENKLPIFHQLLTQKPEHSRLLRFRADAPTTTLQRLKGLTTGSLPTFIDIGSNFATPEINEDNLIDQIVRNRLQTVFLGDSTWTDLYPNRFKRKHAYPSFDIFDLDTVDNEILKRLPSEFENDDWDVLIAHFLGVDHCGHKHGPMHSEMSRKLTEMDQAIRLVIDEMDDDMLLLVLGDHGMTFSGDHGGESEDELNSLLFVHSKPHKLVPNEFGSEEFSLQQIDLVPTVSAILGIPIPYSNLGLINFNVLPDVPVSHMTRYQVLLLHAWQNAKQINSYFFGYAVENKRAFNYDEIESLENKFIVLTHRVNTIYNEAAFKSFMKDLNLYMREILGICRDIWVKFDANQMSQGLLMTFLPVFFGFLLINNTRALRYPRIFTGKTVAFIYMSNFFIGILSYCYFKELSMKSEEHSILFATSMASNLILVFLTLQNWPEIAVNWSQMKRFSNMPTRAIYVASISVFFSNSFIVEEQKILSYLLIGLILVSFYELLCESSRTEFKTKFRWMSFLKSSVFKLLLMGILAIVLLRVSHILFRCREEQGNCNNFGDYVAGLKKQVGSRMHIITVVATVLYTTLTRIYLRSCGNLTGFSINVLLARYGPTVAAICSGGHILLSNSTMKNIKPTHIDAMAWVVFGLLCLQLIVLVASPLMIYVLPKQQSTITVNPYGNVIPELFKKMKSAYEGEEKDRRGDIPVVYGLATVYSSILIAFGVFLALLLAILLDGRAALGIFVSIGVGSAILSIHSVLRFWTASNLETCMQPSLTAIVSWMLLGQFCFYATSHQPTMSQIDWRAAFVGRSANFDQSNFISGVLVMLNTFGGPIFFMTLSSLLNSETFSIYALFPTLIRRRINAPKKNDNTDFYTTTVLKNDGSSISDQIDFDISRGELILYENENLYLGSVFKLASQLFMLQGLRVFCAMMACTIHCRHLMVWKIFAPRYIYEGLATYVTMPAIIFGYVLILRIHLSVNRLVNKINKTK